jgi:BirA family biotin operon repressor/biotin-[acetyl-CoA-carboxylase] ligase
MTPIERLRLDTRHIGRRVLVFDRTDSTNNRAAELASDRTNDGLVVLAKEQSAGRGQHGRSWQCPAGRGVLLSVVLFPPPVLRRPAILTAWAAVSVCETILRLTNLQAKIKWPNDVLIHGRKVCGILIEQRQAAITGIGLNVNQTADDLDTAGLEEATSLSLASGKTFDVAMVAQLLIHQLDEEYRRLYAGDLNTLEACWKWRLGLLGKQVTAQCSDSSQVGRLVDVTWQGLVLEQEGGVLCRLVPEAIRQLQPSR